MSVTRVVKTLHHTILPLDNVKETALKAWWKQEKMLLTMFFILSKSNFHCLSHIYFVVCRFFVNWVKATILSFDKGFNPFPSDNFKALPNSNSLQSTFSNLMKMTGSSINGYKTLWKKEKLLVTSNFSFFHRVFKRLNCRHMKTRARLGRVQYSNTNYRYVILWIIDITGVAMLFRLVRRN